MRWRSLTERVDFARMRHDHVRDACLQGTHSLIVDSYRARMVHVTEHAVAYPLSYHRVFERARRIS
jgi:hypothetical protein